MASRKEYIIQEHKCFASECNNMTTHPKYCSYSCAVRTNNAIKARNRWSSKRCKAEGCNNIPPLKKSYCCDECRQKVKKARKLLKPVSRSQGVIRYRIRQKIRAVEYKGGKCIICSYDKYYGALQFHHINPFEKDFGFASKGKARSFENSKDELDKCLLVCANCHAEIHAGLIDMADYL